MNYTIFVDGVGYVKNRPSYTKEAKFTESMLKATQFTTAQLVKTFLYLNGIPLSTWVRNAIQIGTVACYIDDDALDFDGVIYVFQVFNQSETTNVINTMLAELQDCNGI